MSRHIYSLIVDSPSRNDEVVERVSNLAEELMLAAHKTLSVQMEVMIPLDDGHGLHPIVRLIETIK